MGVKEEVLEGIPQNKGELKEEDDPEMDLGAPEELFETALS